MIIYRDHQPGSKPADKKYVFTDSKKNSITDKEILETIRKWAIPPAWVNVQIDLSPNAKIIFQGYDEKGRLQQKYSATHTKKAKKTKFCSLIEFGKAEARLKSDIKKYISSKRITKNKIISLILKIIWVCGFRVGQIKYKILYESFGVSTLQKRHLTFRGETTIDIEFKGKKSVINKCCIKDRELVKELKEIVHAKNPTDSVFTYKKDGENTLIKPTEINNFLREYGGATSKDLRTLDANRLFIEFMRTKMKDLMEVSSKAKRKKILKEALIYISTHLNNTPTIAKSSYLLTEIYELGAENPKKFKKYFGGKDTSHASFMNYLKKVYCKDIMKSKKKLSKKE